MHAAPATLGRKPTTRSTLTAIKALAKRGLNLARALLTHKTPNPPKARRQTKPTEKEIYAARETLKYLIAVIGQGLAEDTPAQAAQPLPARQGSTARKTRKIQASSFLKKRTKKLLFQTHLTHPEEPL